MSAPNIGPVSVATVVPANNFMSEFRDRLVESLIPAAERKCREHGGVRIVGHPRLSLPTFESLGLEPMDDCIAVTLTWDTEADQ